MHFSSSNSNLSLEGVSQIASAMAAQQAIAACGVGSEFWGSQGRLKSNEVGELSRQQAPSSGQQAGVVRMAISRKKKEETVEKARQQLEGCQLIAGIKYTGLTVKQMQQLRKALPQETTLMVAKNKLIGNIDLLLLFRIRFSHLQCHMLWSKHEIGEMNDMVEL